jgi:hypothetical protein
MLAHVLSRLPRTVCLARPAVRWLHESPFYSINSGVIDAKVDTAGAEYKEALAAMNVHLDDMRKRVESVKQGTSPTGGVGQIYRIFVCFHLGLTRLLPRSGLPSMCSQVVAKKQQTSTPSAASLWPGIVLSYCTLIR